jgi:hypothetical protein
MKSRPTKNSVISNEKKLPEIFYEVGCHSCCVLKKKTGTIIFSSPLLNQHTTVFKLTAILQGKVITKFK